MPRRCLRQTVENRNSIFTSCERVRSDAGKITFFFFPLPPPPPVCYVQPLYRAKGGSWGFKIALVNEEKCSFWTIFDLYVPSTLQHSRFSIWRRMTVRVIIQEPHPPLSLQNSCIQRCSTLWTSFVSWIRFKMSHPSVTKYYVECIDTVVFL